MLISLMSREGNGNSSFSDNKGLWHPSGYYGLFMSRTRLDFDNRFRKSAKPPPPTQFENRLTVHSSQHPFSAHENRHYFQNDGNYFGKDTLIGKRKVNGRSYSAQPGLLNWKHADSNYKFYQGSQHLPHFHTRDPLCVHKDNEIFPTSKFSLKSAYQDAFGSESQKVYKAPHEFDIEPTMKSTYKKAFNGSRNNLPWTSRYSTQ